ncbi:MAG: DNA-binding protein [Roseateles asaccharophilus]|uniref:DNA-binding protein n=1 Tax=Roseateles asaccharophilus TaxID=582607 RepID=UPI003918CD7B
MRKGTMSTPAEALTKFWDDLRSKARVEIEHPDLPEAVKAVAAEAIAGLWRQASDMARQELAAVRIELQAEGDRLQQEATTAYQGMATAQAELQRLQDELADAQRVNNELRIEFETERRAHAGTAARLQESHAQLDQGRQQQQRAQETFSADLAKARQAADARAAAAEKRALIEIDQERQARAKADKLVESLRAQLAQAETEDRRLRIEHAQTLGPLQAQHVSAKAKLEELSQAKVALEAELSALRPQLQASLEATAQYRTQATTLQVLVDRMAPAPTAPKNSNRKKARPD